MVINGGYLRTLSREARKQFGRDWCDRCLMGTGDAPCPIKAGKQPEKLVKEDGRAVCLGFVGAEGMAPRCALTSELFPTNG